MRGDYNVTEPDLPEETFFSWVHYAASFSIAAALAGQTSKLQLKDILECVPASQIRDRLQQADEFTGSHLEAAHIRPVAFRSPSRFASGLRPTARITWGP